MSDLALFDAFPGLKAALPWVELADLPTPVKRLERLGGALDVGALYVKRDDVSGRVYGGNKVRKLEFLLGEALRQRVKEVMTFGCAGSNHAAATAIYARKAGLRSISMLLPQPNSRAVGRNLLLSKAVGAEIHYYETEDELNIGVGYERFQHTREMGRMPMVIHAGGSSPLGVVGFVNAALELKDQIEQGVLHEPDVLYVAAGTGGTLAGLVLGAKLAELKTKIVGVRVTDEQFVNPERVVELAQATNKLLRKADDSVPNARITEKDFVMRDEFYGEAYALFTEAGMVAVKVVEQAEGVHLEGTYTGKAFAALLSDARSGRLRKKRALFWNTYNSRDISPLIQGRDYHGLPENCHHYFEEETQPLDGGE